MPKRIFYFFDFFGILLMLADFFRNPLGLGGLNEQCKRNKRDTAERCHEGIVGWVECNKTQRTRLR